MSVIGDLEEFHGTTYVAFIDISGFKQYVDEGKEENAISSFYDIGANTISDNNDCINNDKITGIFISDSGILYTPTREITHNSFISLLDVIKNINTGMINQNYLTTCSIAFGNFNYQPRMPGDNYRKTALYGKGYVKAFTDNEYGTPKLRPGDCRIINESLPFSNIYEEGNALHYSPQESALEYFRMPLERSYDNKYLYYYWMLNDINKSHDYNREYSDIESKKYEYVKELIKRYLNHRIY